jgi:hypothetical protein
VHAAAVVVVVVTAVAEHGVVVAAAFVQPQLHVLQHVHRLHAVLAAHEVRAEVVLGHHRQRLHSEIITTIDEGRRMYACVCGLCSFVVARCGVPISHQTEQIRTVPVVVVTVAAAVVGVAVEVEVAVVVVVTMAAVVVAQRAHSKR